MTLRRRIDHLEGLCPPLAEPQDLDLDLAPDLAKRVQDARAAGTFPTSLATADLKEILNAAKAAGGGDD